MKNYLSRMLLPLTLATLTSCVSLDLGSGKANLKHGGNKNGVEGFTGDSKAVIDFANRHNLVIYDLSDGNIYAEGITMSRHRYEACTNPNFLDGDATNGASKAAELGLKDSKRE
jgi:hypothetical protein